MLIEISIKGKPISNFIISKVITILKRNIIPAYGV